MADLKQLLETIHQKLAEAMLRMLEEDTATAKEWAVIVKFLKDNDIDASIGDGDSADDVLAKIMARAKESAERHQ
jgi:hypothetical protein